MLSFELIAFTFIVVSISSFDNVTFPLVDAISLLLYNVTFSSEVISLPSKSTSESYMYVSIMFSASVLAETCTYQVSNGQYGNLEFVCNVTENSLDCDFKYGNNIRWIYPPQGNQDSGGTGTPDPDDGLETKVFLIEPIEGKIFLRASRRLMTKNLQRDALVVLPRTLDQYTEIYWNMRSYAYKPTLRFHDSVMFNTPYQPSENADHIYKFSTWDGGETWYGVVSIYNRDPNNDPTQSDNINIEYLEKNYLSKKDIQDNYYSKAESEKVFLTRQQLDGLYLTKNQIEEGYFNREEVEELLSWYVQGGASQIKLPSYMLTK